MRVDIGCGKFKAPGWIGVDIDKESRADIIHDCNEGLPFNKNEIEEIYCAHFLEHTRNPLFIIGEIWRICQEGAKITLIIPLLDWSTGHISMFGPGWFHRNIDLKKFDVTHDKIIEKEITDKGLPYFIFEKHLTLIVKK